MYFGLITPAKVTQGHVMRGSYRGQQNKPVWDQLVEVEQQFSLRCAWQSSTVPVLGESVI